MPRTSAWPRAGGAAVVGVGAAVPFGATPTGPRPGAGPGAAVGGASTSPPPSDPPEASPLAVRLAPALEVAGVGKAMRVALSGVSSTARWNAGALLLRTCTHATIRPVKYPGALGAKISRSHGPSLVVALLLTASDCCRRDAVDSGRRGRSSLRAQAHETLVASKTHAEDVLRTGNGRTESSRSVYASSRTFLTTAARAAHRRMRAR
mmetsp:Transcript_46838/g.144453  ORF Transcript_46838/g.144453 Transcript_46838/m.144453 type:complete len:207 (+) Transcript_46838:1897-2517(+)